VVQVTRREPVEPGKLYSRNGSSTVSTGSTCYSRPRPRCALGYANAFSRSALRPATQAEAARLFGVAAKVRGCP
jgi:hypothetical protein